MTRRTEQVSAELATLIGRYLLEQPDELDGALCTITRVETTPDLAHALVFVSILPDQRRGSALAVLRHFQRPFAKRLFHDLTMKVIPRIHFHIDDVFVRANAMETLLNQVAAELPPLEDVAEKP
ncbi:MAG: ribosome-binding factor A [Patescibacteria group bacterium]